MKRVAEILKGEHRLIGRAAACLDRVVDDAIENDDLCVVTAIDLMEFFEDFVDGAHQEKEERVVFPALLRSGVARHRVRDLLADHVHERQVLESMRRSLEGAAHGDEGSRDELVRLAAEYAALELEHADEEERVLIPLVEGLADEGAERAALAAFDEVDAGLPRSPEDYAQLVERAAARLGAGIEGSLPAG